MKKPRFPFPFGTVHFIGIGGVGMSGIAEIMHTMGYKVQGSDVLENQNVTRLKSMGIKIFIGQQAENVTDAAIVVVSSAIKADNPEVKEAEAKMIPIIHRSDMLAELMKMRWSIAVGGTHGKTTTTSMLSAILSFAGKDPTVVNGGIINSYGTNARFGEGDWMVVEADESDGSFTVFPSTVAIITNIDPDHMNHYKDIGELKDTFCHFANKVPFYGLACVCIDSPNVQEIIPKISRPILTYGLNRQADISALNIKAKKGDIAFDVAVKDRKSGDIEIIKDFHIPLYGEHNVKNALAAIGVALQLNVDIADIKQALAGFSGVKRRFTTVAKVAGVTIIDDYAHHPVEIAAVLKGAQDVVKGKIIAVFQPHRYSRVQSLFTGFCTCFNDAETVIVTDIYTAGEEPLEGVNKESLAIGITKCGHRHVICLEDTENLAELIAAEAEPGDFVIFLGAGNISSIAYSIPEKLEPLLKAKQEDKNVL
ncbi:MAG: UDP-N-acetylmuramate--L-alanine ligase [Alphaproteobacteria bacterium]|nr:UDP-N-acetylmuramate--L-alanine ligase [Alphaproteobacteria bacterium]